MFSWLRPRDRLADWAESLASAFDQQLAASWSDVVGTIPGLEAVSSEQWRKAATIAATLLALFPLLRACGGDAARYRRLRGRALAGLEARYPMSSDLVREAEGATIPPSGLERTRTLHEVDETTSLALGGWVVRRLRAKGTADRSWDDIRRVAEALRVAVAGCWQV